MTAAAVSKRIKNELRELARESYQTGVAAWHAEEDRPNLLTGSIDGVLKSPYAGGVFYLEIQLPPKYPFEPPTIKFTTPIYHPCVSAETGRIGGVSQRVFSNCYCLFSRKSLNSDVSSCFTQADCPVVWAPSGTIQSFLMAVRSLLTDPPVSCDNAHTIIANEAAFLLHDQNFQEYANVAANWTRQFAQPAAVERFCKRTGWDGDTDAAARALELHQWDETAAAMHLNADKETVVPT